MTSRRVLSEAEGYRQHTNILRVHYRIGPPPYISARGSTTHGKFTPPPSQTTSYSIIPVVGIACVLRLTRAISLSRSSAPLGLGQAPTTILSAAQASSTRGPPGRFPVLAPPALQIPIDGLYPCLGFLRFNCEHSRSSKRLWPNLC